MTDKIACNDLYGEDLDGPAVAAVDVIKRFELAPNASTITAAEIQKDLDAFDSIKSVASPPLRALISRQETPMTELLTVITTGQNATIDTSDFKAAGFELVDYCDAYLQ